MESVGASTNHPLRAAAMVAALVTLTLFAVGEAAETGGRGVDADLAAGELQSSNPTYSDEFSQPNLDPKFFFDNPAPNAGGQSYSLTVNPGFLRMITTGPTDLLGNNNTAPKILENAPPGDFQIVTRVLASPDVPYEHAGIIVIQDSTHWIRLIRDSNGNGINLQQGPGNGIGSVPFSGGDVILRLTKTGTSYQGAFSTNGADFTLVGTTVNPLTPTYIGMTVVSTPQDNVFSADFDYFRVSTQGGGGGGVGGIAEPPDVDTSSLEATASGGSSSLNALAVAGAAAAGVIVLGGGGWYVRRRWLH